MPKIVDAEARREAIADSVLAVIAREGLRAATLSSIAAESGLAVGSVRHYFAGHGELLTFAAEALVDRTTARLYAHLASLAAAGSADARRAAAVDMLCEVLPLDGVREIEAAVWLEFAVAARLSTELAHPIDILHDGLRALVTRIITAGAQSGRFRVGIDVDVEIARLHALVDGLVLHGVLASKTDAVALSRRVIETHLETLLAR
ncbi:TetR/AcrR family transcriptional regulator [Paramicrobacterium chengjingii]|uniref:TetR family transcriptional regulator C-terminal domain-containing protein n=1 Tax=Paramicrobacterium chengjingii TaxID=2769067 RepID=A0ABX6YIZ5_9MICO|nr:TetR family transcriptional regulator C-terminal domain-containing protein [Microbacterium chengjingii]QPZ38727.1 TetR family transcriptional regulator C-terminal domain-containing protein [Microbacterium chengjingii]